MTLDPRARTIVKLAAKKVRDRQAKSWLTCDEFGTWERTAQEYLESTATKAQELGLTCDQVNDEIATRLGFLALQARLNEKSSRTLNR